MRLPIVVACVACLGVPFAARLARADSRRGPMSATAVSFGLGGVRFDPEYNDPSLTPFFAVELAHSFASHAVGLVEVGSPLLLFFYPVFPHLLLGGRLHLFAPARGSLTPIADLAAGYEFTQLCPYECAPPNAFAWLARAAAGLEYISDGGALYRLALGRWFNDASNPTWFVGLAFGHR
jgi:hypothetical protein